MKLDIIGSVARLKRVISRWIRQRRGKEHYNTKPTWSFLMDNIKWVFEFNCKKKSWSSFLNRATGFVSLKIRTRRWSL